MLKRFLRAVVNRYPSAYALKQRLDMLPAVFAGKQGGARRSWSQHGEDEQLARDLADVIQTGFYVDVGANHPSRLSNTYRLYCMGMRGLCVEPTPSLYKLLTHYRAEDTVICSAVGPEDGLLTFYQMYPHMFSTFSAEQRDAHVRTGIRYVGETTVPILRLSSLLKNYHPPGRPTFALLSVDTEGFDEQVLRSNDWDRHRPGMVVVEQNDEQAAVNTRAFLASVGYAPAGRFGINEIFRRNA